MEGITALYADEDPFRAPSARPQWRNGPPSAPPDDLAPLAGLEEAKVDPAPRAFPPAPAAPAAAPSVAQESAASNGLLAELLKPPQYMNVTTLGVTVATFVLLLALFATLRPSFVYAPADEPLRPQLSHARVVVCAALPALLIPLVCGIMQLLHR